MLNATSPAETVKGSGQKYFSSDSHVVEAAEVFDGLAERFGTRAPQILKNPNGNRGDFLHIPGVPGIVSVGRLGIAGNRLGTSATTTRIAQGYAGLNPGVQDPRVRLEEQLRDGVVGEVLYPSLSMFSFAIRDDEIRAAAFQRHNDWVCEYSAENPERLVGIGCLPVPDVERSVREAERAANRGVKGFSIPVYVPTDRPYHHPDYEPLWAALESIGLPITMHLYSGTTPGAGMPAHWKSPGGSLKGYTLAHTTAVDTMIDLIAGGVVERFPALRLVLAEFEIGWVAHMKQRMDHAIYRTPRDAVDYLTLAPSEYFDRNFWVTFEDDKAGILTRHLIGMGNLLWGNDYPHHDSTWPCSRSILDGLFAEVPADEVAQLVWGNAVELFGIDTERLGTSLL